jgi:hypothetical protein
MRIQVLERQQRIDRPLDEVFPFYADAANLERIHAAVARLRGEWRPPHRFVDA